MCHSDLWYGSKMADLIEFCCSDRIYYCCFMLKYTSDWACGGQWNRMVSFLAQFVSSLQKANIDLVVFFNGCTETQRMAEWIATQQKTRQKVNQVNYS